MNPIVLGFMLLTAGVTFSAPSHIQRRQDLLDVFAKSFCSAGRPPSENVLWQQKIYDAQLRAQMISPKKGADLSDELLERAASTWAQKNFHLGYVWGRCPGGKAFVVTSPSPTPLVSDQGRLILDQGVIKAYCRGSSLDYAKAGSGGARQVDIPPRSKGRWMYINTEILPSGMLSFACLPSRERWQGPVTWFLSPIKNGYGGAGINIVTSGDPRESMRAWLREVRLKEGLPALEPVSGPALQVLASLYETKNILHNRGKIQKVRQELGQLGVQFVGENRVQASDLSRAVWLLWISPRHRGQILDPQASAVDIFYEKSESGEDFFVLSFIQ